MKTLITILAFFCICSATSAQQEAAQEYFITANGNLFLRTFVLILARPGSTRW